MRKIYSSFILFFAIISLNSFSAQREWTTLNQSAPSKCNPVYTSSGFDQSEINFQLPGFYKEMKSTPRGNAYSISLPGAAKMLQAGMPDIPQLTFSLIVPEGVDMKAEVVSSSYTDYNLSIAPSKGNLKRDIDPSQVPFTYDASYNVNEFIPVENVLLREPYILRDFHGQTVVVRPFQYNPVTQTLRVFYSIKVKVSPKNTINNNSVNRNSVQNVDPIFASVYQSHFLNYTPNAYTPVNEHGNMLVIADASLMTTMQPFIDWKNRMGQKTVMVDVATIGASSALIKTYIENYYTANGLTFVLLVGDGPQIPPYVSTYGDSDPSYGFILGNDHYPEVFVGRFSANTVSELETQVQRSLTYEMNPDPNGQWYHKAVCIGSDQGPGDDNEMDFEHERNMRTDYLAYTYTLVDELYDGSEGLADAAGDPTATDLNTSLNDGRSLVTYTGHGSTTSLGTTGYSVADVSGLTNVNQLPFIWSVACVNGDFNTGTCLAEALMRSTSGAGKATGAVATFMSTINQSWDPPMDAQDEMVDIMVETYPGNIKHTFGGISENGCMHMNDQYGTDGDEMTDTWTVFGDPSLMIRTNTPQALPVTHASTIEVNAASFPVNCTVNGAQVCLSHHNQIIKTGWTLIGGTVLNITPAAGLTVGDTLDLVATAYNYIPYSGQVVVTTVNGISEAAQKAFSIYPNPANGKLTFILADGLKNAKVRIYNSIGQVQYSSIAIDKTFNVDLSSFAAGIYSVVVLNDENILGIEKLIVD